MQNLEPTQSIKLVRSQHSTSQQWWMTRLCLWLRSRRHLRRVHWLLSNMNGHRIK